MFADLINFENKSTVEIGVKIFVITAICFVFYYISKSIYELMNNSTEKFDPSAKTDRIGECDDVNNPRECDYAKYIQRQ